MTEYKKILVTGGAGFIGCNFCRYIIKKYPQVKITVLDALTYAGRRENLQEAEQSGRLQFAHGDIRDRKMVEAVMEGVDAVVNFAAETHVDRSIYFAGDFVETDVMGSYVLLEYARKYNIKIYLQISTDEVYGSILEGSFCETDRLNPSSPYSASKCGGDLLALSYFKTYGLPVVITRSSNNFGPYQFPEKVIPLFITNAIENKPLPLYGDGSNVRDWLYVEDNCTGIDMVLHHGTPGEIYNIGGDNEIKNLEITKKILQLLKKPESLIQPVKDRPAHDFRYSVDTVKIRKLGWKAGSDFDAALEKTVKWYVMNENWWKPLKNKNFEEFYKLNYKKK